MGFGVICGCFWLVLGNDENPKPLGVWGSRVKLCSAVSYSPTPSRVQYHRRWQA